jgi:hypothetical protein
MAPSLALSLQVSTSLAAMARDIEPEIKKTKSKIKNRIGFPPCENTENNNLRAYHIPRVALSTSNLFGLRSERSAPPRRSKTTR